MEKESFILHTNMWPSVQKLTREQRGDLFSAIMCYQLGEELPKMDPIAEMAFSFIAAQMDRDNEKYERIVEKRRAAGKKGADARWDGKNGKCQQVIANDGHNDNDNVNDNVNDNENERDKSLYGAALPPLSPGDETLLRKNAGDERADALIGDVRNYYTAHPEKHFPGWPIALAQFDANQKRWGTAGRKKQKSIDEIIEEMTAEGAFD